MGQIKQIKTSKFEGLAVLVPEGNEYWIDSKITKFVHIGHIEGDAYTIEVPFFCHYIAESTELTEEQCSEIVPQMKDSSYPFEVEDHKVTFENLMRSIGCFSVNPILRPDFTKHNKKIHTCENDIVDYRYDEHQWQEAKANTGTWIILKKI